MPASSSACAAPCGRYAPVWDVCSATSNGNCSVCRLMSGNGDWHALERIVAGEHARWADGIRVGRAAAIPGNELLRVRGTLELTGLPGRPTPPREE